jgi:hypothetical protein
VLHVTQAAADLMFPENVEQIFYERGPILFHRMICAVGGLSEASRISGVSQSVLSKWRSVEPGVGTRDSKLYRQLWFGYPAPFPGLDRIVEEVVGPDSSYLSVLVDSFGEENVHKKMRPFLCLSVLNLSKVEVAEACEMLGIPVTTWKRWWNGVRYPHIWSSLDVLSRACWGVPWWRAVVFPPEQNIVRTTPPSAIACLLFDVK